jgi:hypothetical protein
LDNVTYERIIPGFHALIPVVKPRFGGNSHYIYDSRYNVVGSTSSLLDKLESMATLTAEQQETLQKALNNAVAKSPVRPMPTHTQEEHLQLIGALKDKLASVKIEGDKNLQDLLKEMKKTTERGYIHYAQIMDAQGRLYGSEAGEPPFWFYSWGNPNAASEDDHLGKLRSSAQGKDNTAGLGPKFKEGTEGIGLWFAYPLQLTFYLTSQEDVSVESIACEALEPESMASATVTVANWGYEEHEKVPVLFTVRDMAGDSIYSDTAYVDLAAPAEPSEPDEAREAVIETCDFSFLTPQAGVLEITAEINPEPRSFEEMNYDNNEVTVLAAVGELDLPYWAYSRDILFTLKDPAPTARFGSPPQGSWVGNASGTLYVTDNTPHPQIYRNYAVNRIPGNPGEISIEGGSGDIVRRPVITATLTREEFGDDPLNEVYGLYDPMKRSGLISTGGSVTQEYKYRWSHTKSNGNECYHTEYVPVTSSFGDIRHAPEYQASVYNGIETKDFPEQREFERPLAKTAAGRKFRFDLTWEGTHYPLAGERNYKEAEPSKVIRWMAHLGLDNIPQWEYKVAARYQRTFIGQSSGYIAWEIGESQEKFYESDRKAASDRKTGKGNYDNAVFATDKLLQKHDWPIKSGYYFNPGGTYKCTVYTEQYKDTPEETEEHAELVEKIKEAFCYDNGLYYINTNYQEGRKLGDITYKTDRGILTTEGTEYDLETEELYSAIELDKAEAIDGLIKEVLEGYKESGTEEHYEDARIYREQTDKKLFLVKETTVIEFTLAIPTGKNVYTHVNMKNGEYAININIMDIEFDIKDYLELESGKAYHQSSVMKIPKFTLDRLIITVSGSMYDDRS